MLVGFSAAGGAEKIRRATAAHVGTPVAILVNGEVATAPTLRSPVSTAATTSGNYTRADAEKIVNGEGRADQEAPSLCDPLDAYCST